MAQMEGPSQKGSPTLDLNQVFAELAAFEPKPLGDRTAKRQEGLRELRKTEQGQWREEHRTLTERVEALHSQVDIVQSYLTARKARTEIIAATRSVADRLEGFHVTIGGKLSGIHAKLLCTMGRKIWKCAPDDALHPREFPLILYGTTCHQIHTNSKEIRLPLMHFIMEARRTISKSFITKLPDSDDEAHTKRSLEKADALKGFMETLSGPLEPFMLEMFITFWKPQNMKQLATEMRKYADLWEANSAEVANALTTAIDALGSSIRSLGLADNYRTELERLKQDGQRAIVNDSIITFTGAAGDLKALATRLTAETDLSKITVTVGKTSKGALAAQQVEELIQFGEARHPTRRAFCDSIAGKVVAQAGLRGELLRAALEDNAAAAPLKDTLATTELKPADVSASALLENFLKPRVQTLFAHGIPLGAHLAFNCRPEFENFIFMASWLKAEAPEHPLTTGQRHTLEQTAADCRAFFDNHDGIIGEVRRLEQLGLLEANISNSLIESLPELFSTDLIPKILDTVSTEDQALDENQEVIHAECLAGCARGPQLAALLDLDHVTKREEAIGAISHFPKVNGAFSKLCQANPDLLFYSDEVFKLYLNRLEAKCAERFPGGFQVDESALVTIGRIAPFRINATALDVKLGRTPTGKANADTEKVLEKRFDFNTFSDIAMKAFAVGGRLTTDITISDATLVHVLQIDPEKKDGRRQLDQINYAEQLGLLVRVKNQAGHSMLSLNLNPARMCGEGVKSSARRLFVSDHWV
ncbi:hypothetical protein OAO01_04085 [Oligoflexia bacterium]|nr:hypothetical protein [Oligoflexia bacterium]